MKKNEDREKKNSLHAYEGGVIDRYEPLPGYYPHPNDYTRDEIERLHGVSFIKEVVPGLIKEKELEAMEAGRSAEKVRILDLGGGVGVYAEQIRKEFGEKVKVFTTGLRKKIAKEFRKQMKRRGKYFDGKLNPASHKDDLKFRSIQELKDFEEFDLIIDTVGEFHYPPLFIGGNFLII